MGAVYRSICFETDTFLLRAAALVEKEVKLKLEIEKLMNDGFVNIAKARYIMGSTCVTKMQLPTENSNPIKPLTTVSRIEEDDSWIFYINRVKCLKKNESNGELSIDRSENSECENEYTSKSSMSNLEKSEAAFKHVLENEPKSLKKSKKAFHVEDDLYQEFNNELLDELSNSDSTESLCSVTDPIRLFGILVPNSLKEAQIVFFDILKLLGECATVQLQLRETLEKLSHLKKVKGLIETAAEDMKVDVLTPKVYWTPSEKSSVSCRTIISEERGEEEEKLTEASSVSIQKSIRSVFYDMKDLEPEEGYISVWGSDQGEGEDQEDNDK